MYEGVMDQELVSVRFQISHSPHSPSSCEMHKNKNLGLIDLWDLSVMRADGVLRLLLNSKLYKGLNPTVEGKTVLMTLPNVGEKEMAIICLRVSSPPPVLEGLW